MSGKRRHTILAVDDEEGILKSLRRLLADLDAEVLTATSGKKALDVLKSRDISLIISDQRMPEMTGVEFLQRSREVSPETIRILLTGYADINATIDAINSGAIKYYFNKPWDDDILLSRIRESLDLYNVVAENKRLNMLISRQNKKLKDMNKTLEQRVEKQTNVIRNQHQQLIKSFMETIKAFSAIVELRSKDVGSHSQRVASTAARMIKSLDLGEKEYQDVVVAAFLHDIGKISIPDKIMDKAENTYTSSDLDVVRKHTILGQSCVSGISDFEDVGLIIRHHHENFDGTGYPDGLLDKGIPLGARVVRIADEFDKQSFAKGYPTMKALSEATANLVLYSGTLFDPDLVKKFIELDIAKQFLYKEESETFLVSPIHLKEGMVVAADINTRSGMFVLPRGAKLSQGMIRRIVKINTFDSIPNGIEIHRTIQKQKVANART